MEERFEMIVMSDSHGNMDAVYGVKAMHTECSTFIHCGDSEVLKSRMEGIVTVAGNRDWPLEYPLEEILEIGRHRIYITHGHTLRVNATLELLAEKAASLQCDIACFGHTHRYTDTTLNGIRLLNPGSLLRNKDGSPPCYMKLVLDEDDIYTERKLW